VLVRSTAAVLGTLRRALITAGVPVVVRGDADEEPNETFLVQLSNPSGAVIADGQGVGTISDDDGPAQPDPVIRLAGPDRIQTAVTVSRSAFPADGSAGAVILSRDDKFTDALAGTPLAATKKGPVLLTPTGDLDRRAGAELQRVLARGKVVYLLGGERALSTAVAAQVGSMGYGVTRLAGADAFATAVKVAEAVGQPVAILLATATNFADALSGGAAAAHMAGVVVLTDGSSMPPATASYLTAHPLVSRFALGGPAAAADPSATPVVGVDRYDTSAKVARRFFNLPSLVGLASGVGFLDSLSGGAHIALRGGPLLLVLPSELPGPVQTYLSDNRDAIAGGFLYGGPVAVNENVRLAAQAAIT